MRSLFFRRTPQLADYLGLGLFVVAYLAVIGLVFLPRVYHGAMPRSSVAVEATRLAVGPAPVVR